LFFSSSSFSGCFELNSSRHYNWKNVSPLVVEPEKEATNFSLLLQFNSPIVRKVQKIPRKRRRRKEKDLKKNQSRNGGKRSSRNRSSESEFVFRFPQLVHNYN
jgi:hypothetical protein